MASTDDALNEFAAALRDRCVQILEAAGITPPTVDLVSPGLPAHDCQELAVDVAGLGWEETTPAAQPGLGLRMPTTGGQFIAAYQIAVIRCITVMDNEGRAPTAAEQTADSLRTNKDLWVLWNGLYRAITDDSDPLFQGPCSKAYLDNAVPIDPEGGLAGWIINLRAQIDGTPAVPGS